jgi:hypothetical protein
MDENMDKYSKQQVKMDENMHKIFEKQIDCWKR